MRHLHLPSGDVSCSRRQLLVACGAAAVSLGGADALLRAAEGEEIDLTLIDSKQHACFDMPVVAADASLEDRLLSPVEEAILFQEGSALASLSAASAPQHTIDKVAAGDIPMGAPARAAYKNRWAGLRNNTLKIAFLNGIRGLQDGVMDIAREWCRYADLNFDRVERGRGENVLVRFHRGFGHYSHIGKESMNQVASGQPSMNFAFLDRTTFDLDDKYNHFVVLHEFGHALGCIHEHQHPGATVRFRENDPRVIQYFQKGLNTRSLETIRFNVFRRWNDKELLRDGVSEYDERSIMHYAFPAWMFQDGKARTQNYELSPLDRRFAAIMYPTRDGPKVPKPDDKKDLPTPPKVEKPGEPGALSMGNSVAAAISPGTSVSFRFTLSAADASRTITIATQGATPVVLQLYPASERTRELTPGAISNGAIGYGTYDFINGAIQAPLSAGSYDLVVSHVSKKGGGKFSVSLKSGEQYRRLYEPNKAR